MKATMTHQRDIGKFPTEKPPDPENGSPGAVATATGAKLQSVLNGTLPIYCKLDPIVQSHSLHIERLAAFQDCDVRARRRRDTAETETTTTSPNMVAPLNAAGACSEHGGPS
jgi:hypothetical protein